MKYTPFKHQEVTINALSKNRALMIGSDPGTGKTLCIIHDIVHRLHRNPKSKTLIIAPKSILFSAWRDDFIKFAPHLITSVATAPTTKRKAAFDTPANVYITNTDAVKWLIQQQENDPLFLQNFETIVVDESGFFMNSSARTKALLRLRTYFKYARALNGTLIGGPMTNLYYQYYFLAGAQYVGKSFNKFRNMTMYGKSKPNMPQYLDWVNKPGIQPIVAKLLEPITIRHALTDVVDMPSRVSYTYKYKPNDKVKKAYADMKRSAHLQIKKANKSNHYISAVNAAATVQKLAQVASGSAITTDGKIVLIDSQRYDLVIELINQYKNMRPLVFFNYKAQRIYMMEFAEKAGLKCTYIEGSVSTKERATRVTDFQAGKYDVLFLNPMAASHGLTLTASTCNIWSVPIYRGDILLQSNARSYRIGQKERVITLYIEATGTLERGIYKKLEGKVSSIELLNSAIEDSTK